MNEQSLQTTNWFKVLIGIGLIGAITALFAYTYLTLQQAKGTYTGEVTISVNGTGEAVAVPDIGQFTFDVRTEAETADVAQSQNAETTNTILAWLKEQGVAETDIRTNSYNLNPRYQYEERICSAGGYCPPGERVLTGYEVRQSVTVRIQDLDTASTLIGGVGEQGATNISSLTFTIDDEDALQAEARSEAITDAKAKAEVLASELGMKLGKLVGFHEQGPGGPIPYGLGGDMMEERAVADGMATAPALPRGENEIVTNVSMTYRLK